MVALRVLGGVQEVGSSKVGLVDGLLDCGGSPAVGGVALGIGDGLKVVGVRLSHAPLLRWGPWGAAPGASPAMPASVASSAGASAFGCGWA